MGIPVSNRQGGSINQQNRKGNNIDDRRGPKPKAPKENKEKMEADFKQSLEGLSIVGTAANNKKK